MEESVKDCGGENDASDSLSKSGGISSDFRLLQISTSLLLYSEKLIESEMSGVSIILRQHNSSRLAVIIEHLESEVNELLVKF